MKKEENMATVSMPHIRIECADNKMFKKKAKKSEKHLKQNLDVSTMRGRVLKELLNKSFATVVVSTSGKDDYDN